MVSFAWPPTFMSCRPSVQPLITPLSGKEIGSPRAYDESKMVPSISLPDLERAYGLGKGLGLGLGDGRTSDGWCAR